jgi:hypothetical protein
MSVGLLLAFGFALGWIPLYVYRTEAMRDAFPYYSAAERRWMWLSPTLVALQMEIHAHQRMRRNEESRPVEWVGSVRRRRAFGGSGLLWWALGRALVTVGWLFSAGHRVLWSSLPPFSAVLGRATLGGLAVDAGRRDE